MAKWSDILAKLMGSGVITVDEAGQQTISNTTDLEGVEVEGLEIFDPIVPPMETVVTGPVTDVVQNVSREELTAIIDKLTALEQLVIAVDNVNNVTNNEVVEEW